MEVAPFFVDFHHFLSIFTIFYRFSRFTHFCRDLRTFSAIFFGQNSHLRNITRFLHVWGGVVQSCPKNLIAFSKVSADKQEVLLKLTNFLWEESNKPGPVELTSFNQTFRKLETLDRQHNLVALANLLSFSSNVTTRGCRKRQEFYEVPKMVNSKPNFRGHPEEHINEKKGKIPL